MPLVASDHTTNVCLLTSWDPSELTDRDKSHEFKSFDRVVSVQDIDWSCKPVHYMFVTVSLNAVAC